MTDSAEEYQATQAESYPETQIEEDWTSHETVSDVDDTVLWGTLKNQGGLAHIELRTKPESVVQGKDELHEHVIGRNPALCDHVVDFDQVGRVPPPNDIFFFSLLMDRCVASPAYQRETLPRFLHARWKLPHTKSQRKFHLRPDSRQSGHVRGAE